MPEDYEVEAGDCFNSIAFDHGFFWKTLWDHGLNAELKSLRKDPGVLLPGDLVRIPDLRAKEEEGATEKRHRFKLKGVPALLRLRLLEPEDPDQEQQDEPPGSFAHDGRGVSSEDPVRSAQVKKDRPRAKVSYHLIIDGRVTQGKTDADGRLEETIPPNAREGKLIILPGTEKEVEMPLFLGHLDPISEVRGVKQRLANLSFECGDRDDEINSGLGAALANFQAQYGLPVTGELTDEVWDQIKKAHGS